MDLFSKNIGYQGIFFHTIVQFVYSEWSGHHIFILSLQRGTKYGLDPSWTSFHIKGANLENLIYPEKKKAEKNKATLPLTTLVYHLQRQFNFQLLV